MSELEQIKSSSKAVYKNNTISQQKNKHNKNKFSLSSSKRYKHNQDLTVLKQFDNSNNSCKGN